jgi:methenyltetrahydromethanopterin cyclohydrolase
VLSKQDASTAIRPKAGRRDWPSVSKLVEPLVQSLLDNTAELRVGVTQTAEGATIVDAGIDYPGGIEAGRLITEICMGGLGRVSIAPSPAFRNWPWQINVRSLNPVLACLGSQYAGWGLNAGGFSALGSGPARAMAAREELFADLEYRDAGETACLVLEVDKPPPPVIIEKVCHDCLVAPNGLTVILAPTMSLAGSTQVVGRVLEVAVHKAHAVDFPLEHIVDGMATAPLAPPAGDFITGMGRTNDAIIFGGSVHLFVTGPEKDAHELAHNLPAESSRDYGKPFADIFRAYKGDFYAIDDKLFSPAQVIVTALDSGKTFHAGGFNEGLLDRCFGYEGG